MAARWRPSRARSGRSTSRPASSRPRSEPGSRRRSSSWSTRSARLYPVGRLDADSTGLILLTNDGELANRLTHPRYEVPKAYRVELRRPPSERRPAAAAQRGRAGGRPTAPAEVSGVGEREIEIVLREGRNRQVRRMVEAVGNQVVALRRVRFGSLELGGLRRGRGPPAQRRGDRRALERFRVDERERTATLRRARRRPGASNEPGAIVEATEELMRELIDRNDLDAGAMVSCLFTSTDDLDAEFPAVAARKLGLDTVPLLCAPEIDVPGAMPRVIRAMVHYYAPGRSHPGPRLPRRGAGAALRSEGGRSKTPSGSGRRRRTTPMRSSPVTVAGWRTAYRDIVAPDAARGSADRPLAPRGRGVGSAAPGRGRVQPTSPRSTASFAGYCFVAAPSTATRTWAPDVAELVAIYVDPDHWRQGAGAALMRAALERARRASHYDEAVCGRSGRTQPAIAFYERLGWRSDEHREDPRPARGRRAVAAPGPSRTLVAPGNNESRDDRHLRREARPHAGLPGRRARPGRRRRRSPPAGSPSSPPTSRRSRRTRRWSRRSQRAAGAMNRYPDPDATLLRRAHRRALRDRARPDRGRQRLLRDPARRRRRRSASPGAEILYAWPSFSMYPYLPALTGRARDPRAARRGRRPRPRRDGGRGDRGDPAADRLQPEQPDRRPTSRRPRSPPSASGSPPHVTVDPRRGLRRVPDRRRPRRDARPARRASRTWSSCAPSASATASPGCGSATRSAPPKFRAAVDAVRQPFSVNALAQAAGGRGDPAPGRRRCAGSRARSPSGCGSRRALRELGLATAETQANFSWIDLGDADEARGRRRPRRARDRRPPGHAARRPRPHPRQLRHRGRERPLPRRARRICSTNRVASRCYKVSR